MRAGLGDATLLYTSPNCFSRQLRRDLLAEARRARVRCVVSMGRPFEPHTLAEHGLSLAWSEPVPATFQSSATAFFYDFGGWDARLRALRGRHDPPPGDSGGDRDGDEARGASELIEPPRDAVRLPDGPLVTMTF